MVEHHGISRTPRAARHGGKPFKIKSIIQDLIDYQCGICVASPPLTNTARTEHGGLTAIGHRPFTYDNLIASHIPPTAPAQSYPTFHHPVADENGLIAMLERTGQLHLKSQVDRTTTVPQTPETVYTGIPAQSARSAFIRHPAREDSPRLAAVASTSTGSTACIPLEAPGAGMMHIVTFPDFGAPSKHMPPSLAPSTSDGDTSHADIVDNDRSGFHLLEEEESTFLSYLSSPTDSANSPSNDHIIPGIPSTLLATATAFILLTTHGRMYTWGDPRYGSCLGRPNTVPAQEPGVVEALEGLQVEKIVANASGWIMGCLTEAGDAWVWGFEGPGAGGFGFGGDEDEGGWFDGVGDTVVEDGVRRIELPSPSKHEEVDVVDMAIGRSHILVLDDRGHVWGIGSNKGSQLGLGDGDGVPSVVRQWTRVPLDAVMLDVQGDLASEERRIVGVNAGHSNSFVIVGASRE